MFKAFVNILIDIAIIIGIIIVIGLFLYITNNLYYHEVNLFGHVIERSLYVCGFEINF